MKKLFAVVTLLCAFVSANLFAADVKAGSIKAPGKGKVVLVGRMTLKNAPNFQERAIAFGFTEKNLKKPCTYSIGDYTAAFIQTVELDEPFYYTAKVEKDGTVTLPYFQICLFGYPYLNFRLPMKVKLSIPEGASYVYIGEFNYDLDYALRVKKFNHYDEYDKATEWINRATGKNVDLYRAELEFLK